MNFFRQILDVVFPPHKDVVDVRAVSEEALLDIFNMTYNPSVQIYTGLPYRDPRVRALIRANKFHADTHATALLATVLNNMLAQMRTNNPLMIPIPSSTKRRRMRGFNQVEKIIDAMPQETLATMRYVPHILKRKERKSQAHVARHERIKNVANAFYVPENFHDVVSKNSALLIDDVTESGATMQDAMRALKFAGAKHIIGIALAK